MRAIKDISFAGIGGATIAVASFIGNIIRIGYLWDQILIPFLFLAFKKKRPSMPMIWPAIVAAIALIGYKFYLGFFIFGYCLIASVIYKFKAKITISSLFIIALTYVVGYFGVWIAVGYFVHNININELVYLVVGTKVKNKSILTLMLILEPAAFAFLYQYMMELMERSKMFNG